MRVLQMDGCEARSTLLYKVIISLCDSYSEMDLAQ